MAKVTFKGHVVFVDDKVVAHITKGFGVTMENGYMLTPPGSFSEMSEVQQFCREVFEDEGTIREREFNEDPDDF